MKKALTILATLGVLFIGASATALAEEADETFIPEVVEDSIPIVMITDSYKPYENAKYELVYDVRYYRVGEETVPRVVITGCKNYQSKDDLGQLVIPSTINDFVVYRIDDYAFHNYNGFTGDLKLPDGLAEIGEFAFSGCTGLSGKLVLPEGLKKIEAGAFYDCKGLKGDLVIPATVESIGKCAFLQCESFTKHIYIKGNTTIENQEEPAVVTAFERKSQSKSEIVIHAPKDSAAEKYAAENGYAYSDNMYSVTIVFNDVKTTDWWLDAVQYAYDNEIMSGTGSSFQPTGNLTREQFVQVLYSHSGKPAVSQANKFTDVVAGQWYEKAVIWANMNGITSGKGNGIFGVGQNISREELAVMLYGYAKTKGYSLTTQKDVINNYVDGSKVSAWAREALDWAVTQGIISGKAGVQSTYLLDPQGNATRAECAAMMRKLLTK